MRSIPVFFASLAVAFAQAVAAQDIPTRVGRLAYTQGPVSVYQDPELGWDKAYVNTPVTSENSVWTDRGARAEVRVGGISVRLDGETQLDVARLDDNDFDAGVARGSVNVHVRYKERDDHITLNTQEALFTLDTDGRYRLDVDEDRGQARLTVFAGSAHMETARGRVPVQAGRMVIVAGGQYGVEGARADEFDRWADSRDRQWADSRSRNYVSYDMTGYEELDRYGTWSQDADYGAVWYPTQVQAGWAPYRYGHWSYVRPWGWTWIDDAPWGYAPSHYGRWVSVGNRWAWAPGYTVRERPTWAPALVGFIGGAGFSVALSSGAPVGWYPLAPWERYQPWYRTSSTYVTRVNNYVVDRRPSWYRGGGDEWRQWNRERAATVVNRDVFVNRRAVQNSVVRMSPETIRQATVVSGEQAVQQALPQRNEVVRYRQEARTNVAAPKVMREQGMQPNAPQASAPAPQASAPAQKQQIGQVVRPDFRRRGPAAAVVAAPAGQPAVSAPAPQQQQSPFVVQQPPQQQQQQQQREQQNPAARGRALEEAARTNAQQQREQQQILQTQQRNQQEQAQRAAKEAQQQQERAAQEGQQRQQREQAQREQQQRQQQEQAQRAAKEVQQQQQQQAQRQREEQQRAAKEAQQQQQQSQRQQQEQQRAAREAQQQQQQQAQRQQQEAQRQQQEQQRAAREAQQRQQQPQPQPPQAQREARPPENPAARGDGGGRNREKEQKEKEEKEKKDKDKEKDKR